MPRAPVLPERLRYLQPFRKKFARCRPENLNEDTGSVPLLRLLAKRIHGLTLESAATLLEQDHAALEDWLGQLGGKGDPLHFALGFFITTSGEELARVIMEEAEKPPEPKLHLHWELPLGAKQRHVPEAGDAGMLVRWKGLLLAIDALTDEALANLRDASGQHWVGVQSSTSEVRFGQVSGTKIVSFGESWRGPYKHASYFLNVPGGHVEASVSSTAKDELNWDESKLEAHFHTLHVSVDSLPSGGWFRALSLSVKRQRLP